MVLATITEPSADALQRIMYNKGMRGNGRVTIPTNRKFAVTLIELAGAVDQPGDYAVLKAAIVAIAGIQDIHLLVDGQAPSSIPANTELSVVVDGNLRIEDLPPE